MGVGTFEQNTSAVQFHPKAAADNEHLLDLATIRKLLRTSCSAVGRYASVCQARAWGELTSFYRETPKNWVATIDAFFASIVVEGVGAPRPVLCTQVSVGNSCPR